MNKINFQNPRFTRNIAKISKSTHYAFQVEIHSLLPDERYYLPQETGNYSVAGFRSVNNIIFATDH